MADDVATYRARAALERANAEATSLENVRDRCERSATAWSKMADQAERTLEQRRVREAATAERSAAVTSVPVAQEAALAAPSGPFSA